jgi:glucosylceramidase
MRFIIQAAILAASLIAPAAHAANHVQIWHVQVWETTVDQTKLLARQADVPFKPIKAPAAATISVDPGQGFQTMVGFGAAMTDASAFILNHDLTPAQRDAVMSDLFAPGNQHLSFTRLTIGASDFSSVDYSYDDMPSNQSDPTLSHFSIARAEVDVVPMVKAAMRLNPDLKIMASPWSAPGWMKTSDSLIGGGMRTDTYGPFAAYLVRYVQAMQADGVPISALTLQNEPGFAPKDYPGELLPPEQRAHIIGSYLGPALKAAGLTTRILDYDHNWDRSESPMFALADATANPYIAGVAWHCYGGEVAAQSQVHDAFPTKDAYFTECSGGEWTGSWGASFDDQMKNLIIGSTRNWAKGVLLWNLVLDENKGPHLGGCDTCRGIITVNSKTGAVTKNLDYYALGHASRFVAPGAVRIAATETGDVVDVAFRNTDGSIVLIALNTGKAAQAFNVQSAGQGFAYTLPAGAAATFVWKPLD